jgi:hypothetical protein
MAKYRTKQVEVEAVQWTGENRAEVEALEPDHVAYYRLTNSFLIDTPDTSTGCEQVGVGDYVVKGADGSLRRLQDEAFYQQYEPVEAS